MNSHKQIFSSAAIIGGASVINMLIGIIKVKALALLLGPGGVGLMGLYQNIMAMASTLAGCGMRGSGVRQLASSTDEETTLAIVRRALWLGHLILGLIGMTILWLLREPVAHGVFGNASHASAVGWLGVGVLLTLISASQGALLQGLRRIGDIARVNIFSALIGTLIGILAIYLLGEEGILWFVLTAPAAGIVAARYYVARLPHSQTPNDWLAIQHQWLAMLKLGIPLMIGGLLILATELVARSIILRNLGLEASGHFQAAWAISMTYIGFVLAAMSTDYYPRLTSVITDHKQAKKLVNEQAEMALLLAGPVLLMMITLAPWVITFLYAESFAPATDILRWQILGDILKVSCWPMGFIVLAQGRGGVFIAAQLAWSVAYLGSIAMGIQEWGLVMTGVGFWFSYLVSYGVMILISNRLIGFMPALKNWLFTLLLLLAGGLIVFLTAQSPGLGTTTGLLATGAVSVYSFWRLESLIDLREWIRRKFGY